MNKFSTRSNSVVLILFAFIFAIVIPICGFLGLISETTMNLWGRYLCFAIAALGVDLVWGYAGILSLCQAFFFCLGGYCIGMHMLLKTGTEGVYGSTIPDFMVWNRVEKLPWFWEYFHTLPGTLILGVAVAAVAAGLVGYLTFRRRLKGVYFAILTQALALAMWLVFLRNETMLGGTNGLTDFKRLAGFDLSQSATKMGLYFVTVFTLITVYLLCLFLTTSKFGKVLIAIRDSEHRLRFTGYSIHYYKTVVYILGAVIAAIGGMLYVPQTGIITPGRMDVMASILMVVWVAVGGRGSLAGAVLGALVVNFAYSILTAKFPGTWPFFLGSLFIVVVLLLPQGLIGLFSTLKHYLSKGNLLKRF